MADYADRVLTVIEADTMRHDVSIRTSTQLFEQYATKSQQSASTVEASANRAFTAISLGATSAGGAVTQFALADLRAAQAIGEVIKSLDQAARSFGTVTAEEVQAARAIGSFAVATKQLETASSSGVAGSGRFRAGLQQLGFQLGDISQQISTGWTPATVIFAQQSGQVVQAIQLMGGEGNGFVRFLASGWGIGIAAAAVALLPFIANLLDTRSEVQKATDELEANARKANIARQAQINFGQTLAGVEQAIRSETAALEQQNRSLEENQTLTVQRTQQQASSLETRRADVIRDLAAAYHELITAQQAAGQVPAGDLNATVAAAARLQHANDEVQRLRAENARIQGNQADNEREQRLAQVPGAQRNVADRLSLVADATDRLAEAEARLRVEYENGGFGSGVQARERYEQRLLDLRRAGQAQIERAQQREEERRQAERAANRDYSSVSFSEVKNRIIANEGTARVGGYNAIVYNTTPSTNSRGIPQANLSGMTIGQVIDYQLSAIRPRTRGHPSANDPRGVGSTGVGAYQFESRTLAANARAAFGAGFRDVLFTGQNQDVIAETLYNAVRSNPAMLRNTWAAFSGRRGTTGSGGDAAAQVAREEQQRLERERNEAAFQSELGRQNEALLNARQRNIASAEEQAQLEIQQVEAARQRQNAGYDAAVLQGRLTQAQADQLKEINDQTAIEEARTVKIREQQRLDEQRLQITLQDLNDQESVLQARSQLAQTAMERRDIELRLLDLQHKEELLTIERQRAQARQQGTLNAEANAGFDRQIDAANARHGLATQGTLRSTAQPLEAFLNAIPRGAQAMNEALQEVAVHGLQSLNDGLAQAATNFLHLGGVAGSILNQILSDLIRIGLQQAELAAFGGGKGGGGGLLSTLGSIFGTGASKEGGSGFDFGSFIGKTFGSFGSLPGHASGYVGPIGGMGGVDRNILSINGIPRARVSGSETLAIIPQGKALGYAGGRAMGGSGAPVLQKFEFDLRGAVLTADLLAQMNAMADRAANDGAAGGATYVTKRAANRARQTL